MATLTEQLKKIQDDIIVVLNEKNKPMTQYELFNNTHLEHMSYFGWSFALDKLEKQKLIKLGKDDKWTLIKRNEN